MTPVRTALVTGASRGIGRGVALHLARQGYGLTVTSRSEADLLALSEELRAAGAAQVVHAAADLADLEALPAVCDAHGRAYGSMDALVLCGGVGTAGAVQSFPLRRYDKTMAVNLGSSLVLVQAALPLLRTAADGTPRGAKIVALASLAGVYSEPGLAVYGASKAALISLLQTVNAEESGNGVTATAIAPGYVDTDMSAWTHDSIPPETMIPVADVVSVVDMLLALGRTTSIPSVIMTRSGTDGHRA